MAIPPPTRSDIEKLHQAIRQHGTKAEAARALGMARTTLRDQLEIGARLYDNKLPTDPKPTSKGRRYLDVTDGVIYVGGDAHYWPSDEPSTAHRAFVRFIQREKSLTAVVMNGDSYDFPNISRHDSDWFKTPSVRDELEVVEDRLNEIIKAGRKAKRFFTRGNHDIRFDRYLAKNAPEMRGISGMCIEDRNPLWEPCWSLFINDGPGGAVIKHRPPKGGMHSTSNSTLWAGRTTVCNHLHNLQCRPLVDFNGTRWGVDAGCLADIYGPQFSYLEDNPRSWSAGFVRMKWVAGRLLTPELIRVVEPDVVEFRGELIEV
jgi:hypothetical protein